MTLGVKDSTVSSSFGSWAPSRVAAVVAGSDVPCVDHDQVLIAEKKEEQKATLWQSIKNKVIGFFSSILKYLKSLTGVQIIAKNADYICHYGEASKAKGRDGARTHQELVEYHEKLRYEPGRSIDNKIYSSHLTKDGQSKPLVVLVLGKNQSLKGSRSKIGLLKIYDDLRKRSDVDVVLFRVGGGLVDLGDSSGSSASSSSDDSECPFHSSVVLEHTVNILEDMLNGKGKFSGYQKPSKLVFAGFSWGGGTVDQIVNNHQDKVGDIPISTAYVDAVRLGFGNLGCGVERRPECSSRHLHIHQENDLHGVHGLSITNCEKNDIAIQVPDAFHKDIDDNEDVIRQVASFIEDRITS